MKDSDIIKALECCTKGNTSDVCVDCPLRTTDICTEEENGVLKLTLDHINRQKAEIEMLHTVIKNEQDATRMWHGQAELNADEIIKLQAEIDRLKKFNKEYRFCNLLGESLVFTKTLEDYNNMRKGLKAEAIKEFADRLKNATLPIQIGGKHNYDVISKQGIDHILKEMVGEGG